jgi:hypothetical protein
MINLDKLDPDWEFAKVHGKASFAGMQYLQIFFQKLQCRAKIIPIKMFYVNVVMNMSTKPKYRYVKIQNNSNFRIWISTILLIFKNCIILLLLASFSYNVIVIKMAID